ncbi:sulfotransferase [Synechococcus sp. PCC 7335]|uniref:sulfotransferase n=1 Tax=Synechococcus sp. (strain ATCC 29403 / PCC 7335) TaxID=91464 RepID=UPI001D0D4620|nr:sulfotransferase [Synechococcus sp. PCC 7335]
MSPSQEKFIMLPNFLGIGTQRSGSTWLYENLKKHPDLYFPPFQKELHYFDARESTLSKSLLQRLFLLQDTRPSWLKSANGWRDKIFKEKVRESVLQLNLIKTFQYTTEYLTYNSDVLYSSAFELGHQKLAGEITPSYSTLEKESVGYIHQTIPDLKIIFLMRNPIQRAWSHALKDIRKTQSEKLNDISDEEFIVEFESRGSRLRGNYLRTLENWKFHYPDKQFLICFFEEISEAPDVLISRICNFLDIRILPDCSNSIIRDKVNSRQQRYDGEIPHHLAMYLAKMYFDQINKLERQFGRYTTNWLEYASKL